MYAVDRNAGAGLQALEAKKAHIAEVDVASPESINKFKGSLGDTTIDLLLNIAGGTTSKFMPIEADNQHMQQVLLPRMKTTA